MKAHSGDERVNKASMTINELIRLIVVGLAIVLGTFNAYGQSQQGRSPTALWGKPSEAKSSPKPPTNVRSRCQASPCP